MRIVNLQHKKMENRLISMTEFVLEQHHTMKQEFNKGQNGNEARLDFVDNVSRYANFLKQPLTLSMFVPCNEAGEVLQEPEMYGWLQNVGGINSGATEDECLECEIYHAASQKVLFEGFSWNPVLKQVCNSDTLVFADKQILDKGNHTIEDLVQEYVTLTSNALKLIYV